MSELEKRIRKKKLLERVMKPEDTIKFFENGMDLGWSGFTPVGYPKKVPIALADYVEKNNLQGKLRFNLFIGASVGVETEDRWAALDMIDRRWPYQTGKNIQKGINTGKIRFGSKHLSMFAQDLKYGFYTKDKGGKLDIGIIEASGITENGGIILAGAVGSAPEIIDIADKLIIEINTKSPSFEGMHDVLITDLPPHRKPYLITRVQDRIGTTYVPCDHDKIVAIVESDLLDNGRELAEPDDLSNTIAGNIMEFFKHEVKMGRLPENLLPLQSGVGNIANAIVGGFVHGDFQNLNVYTEVLQDTMLDLFDSGKLDFASATSLSLSNKGFKRFFEKFDEYKERIVLRPQQITNNPEIIRRLGCIGMNTPVEFDIYAHANSENVLGTRMINGLGGSGDFERNSYLSIMHAPSCRPSKNDEFGITTVLPKVTHVDHTEHDIDVLVTEQGLADLRGLAPKERAKEIIDKCAHPAYKDYLYDYLDRATKLGIEKGMGHEPHLLDEVYKMQLNFIENGTMRFWEK